jgi:hypothetical protein
MALSKRLRFEVFKRDKFTCQYCGRKSPDVLLEADHIHPKSKGGKNDLLNLITSCKDCNSGKSNRLLTDDSIIEKKRQQLEELQGRKEQLDMMFEWQKGLLDLDNALVTRVSDFWSEKATGYSLSEYGIKTLRNLLRKYRLEDVMNAICMATDRYLKMDKDGKYTHDSINDAWNKVGGICYNTKLKKDDPQKARIFYIRGILKNRLNYMYDKTYFVVVNGLLSRGISVEQIEQISRQAYNWTEWQNLAEALQPINQ